MLSLLTAAFPSSAADLQRLLNEALERIFISEHHPVTVCDRSYPRLGEIAISLDGACLRPEPPNPPSATGAILPALEIDQLSVNASPLSIGPVALNLSISAAGVQLGQSQDSNGQIILSLKSAAQGNIKISMQQSDIEALITKLAGTQASKQGVTIEGVQLTLRPESAHSLAVEVRLRARKLFIGAALRVTGQLDLNDQLSLKISGLNCTGDGGIGAMACGILKPYLEKFDGREFPMLALPLKGISLRDVRFAVDDDLTVSAEFGSAS
jgi:hypothetical protein